jgi:hypothetical protein
MHTLTLYKYMHTHFILSLWTSLNTETGQKNYVDSLENVHVMLQTSSYKHVRPKYHKGRTLHIGKTK